MIFYAHSGTRADRGDWQELTDHLAQVETLAAQRGAPLGLAAAAGVAGRLHDLGKYDPAFDRVLCGENIRVDHSTAGGRVLFDPATGCPKVVAEALAHAILGHHAGLPDTLNGNDNRALTPRISAAGARLAPEWVPHLPNDFKAVMAEFAAHIRRGPMQGFDFALAVRMVFSCLVDADFRDTEAFYDQLEGRKSECCWPSLQSLLPDLRTRFSEHMARFKADSDLNQLRADILAQVRAKAALPSGVFTLSVPTGGGKTLASLGFALDHAAQHGHRRIIYAIPYTSIIDQTAKIFRDLLGAENVLEHHSAIETDGLREKSRDKARQAMEDWAAPVVVTTNVQLFESLFAARPSRTRKLHNIAGAVIVLDEAQCLPRKLLLPTLAMLDTLCAHYGCTVVLCTATQPAFDSAQLKGGGLAGRELAPDPVALAERLRRVRIGQGGAMQDQDLIAALADTPQGFVIVNSRKHALALFEAGKAAGLDGLVHLTTRQYPADRRAIIEQVRQRLTDGRPCRLIATSLIEAGVDLDFPCGWRAEAGLDSVIQAAGRVNREGRRPLDASVLTVFSAPENPPPGDVENLAQAMRTTALRHDDLLAPAAIRNWFEAAYWRAGEKRLDEHGLKGKFVFDGRSTQFLFRETAERYQMIDSPMVPVIIPCAQSQPWIDKLSIPNVPSGKIARALQAYIVQIPHKARETLRTNGKGDFAAPDVSGGVKVCHGSGGNVLLRAA